MRRGRARPRTRAAAAHSRFRPPPPPSGSRGSLRSPGRTGRTSPVTARRAAGKSTRRTATSGTRGPSRVAARPAETACGSWSSSTLRGSRRRRWARARIPGGQRSPSERDRLYCDAGGTRPGLERAARAAGDLGGHAACGHALRGQQHLVLPAAPRGRGVDVDHEPAHRGPSPVSRSSRSLASLTKV